MLTTGRRNGGASPRVLGALSVLLVATLAAGCGGAEPARPAAVGTVSGAKTGMEATVGVASTTGRAGDREAGNVSAGTPPEAGSPFVSGSEVGGGSSYEADSLLAVRYGAHGGYERVVLDLGTGREPAGAAPEWRTMSPAGDGLLRVTLPSVSATRVSYGPLAGSLLDSFYVVRASEGGMLVDVFATKGFEYRVPELSDPARLAVDFKTTGAPLGMPMPAKGGSTVLTEPRSGARIGDPLTVSGYSRNPEAANVVVLTDHAGEVLAREMVDSNDWSATWGYFEATLDLPPFSGRGTLRVGAASARDGAFEGAKIRVSGNESGGLR